MGRRPNRRHLLPYHQGINLNSGLAWAAAERATIPATVRARIKVYFTATPESAGSATGRVPRKVTLRYNFRVIITKYIAKRAGNAPAHRRGVPGRDAVGKWQGNVQEMVKPKALGEP